MRKNLLFAALCCVMSANAQLRLVRNLNGNSSSDAKPIVVANNRLIITATSNFVNNPYSTDGTTNNFLFVVNSVNGEMARSPFNSFSTVVLNGEVHFMANYYNGSTINYSRLTKASFTNTTCNGYANLSGSTGNQYSELAYPVVLNNEILFVPSVVDNANVTGVELYKSDGTTLSFVKNINPNLNASSNPAELTVLGTNCFFSANDGTNGRELWKTDGTTVGTTLYLDMIAGSTASNPTNLNVIGTQLTFVGTHPTLGRELFRTNGVGSLTLIKDINTSGDSNPTNVTPIGSELYFSATNGSNGQEPYFSSGVNLLATSNIKDVNPGSGSSNPTNFTKLGSLILFSANDGTNGNELWITDGTPANTYMVKNINPTGDSNPSDFTVYNGKLYFIADNGTNGKQLWVTDGSGGPGTSMITINPSGTSNISNLLVYNNELYFSADAGVGIGKELYAYMDPALSTNSFSLDKNAISLFPNPSKDYFELSGEVTIEKVEIYSIQGQLIKSFQKENQYVVSDLSKGMYIVKIKATEGILNKTLIIE